MARYVRGYRDFSGGLSELANDNMADNQLIRAQNIIPGDGHGICRSFGLELAFAQMNIERVDGSNQYVRDLVEFTTADGEAKLVAFTELHLDAQNILEWDSAALNWKVVSYNQFRRLDGFVHANKVYWLIGRNLMRYDGKSYGVATQTPMGDSITEAEEAVWEKVKKAVAVEQRGQRWFYATADKEVIFSEIGEPTKIDPTNIININTKDNDSITALKEFNNGLLIFLRRSVYYLSGWDLAGGSDIVLTRLNVTSGTEFPRTIQTVENAVLYLGTNGVYRLRVPSYSGIIAAENISEHKISKAVFEYGPLSSAWSTVWNNVYYLGVRSDNDRPDVREYRYYPELDAFFGEYTHGGLSYNVLSDNRLYVGLPNSYIARFDKEVYHYINSDDGSPCAIPVNAVTKGYDVSGGMVSNVRLQKALISARQYPEQSSHVTLRIKADYDDCQYDLNMINMDESMNYGEAVWGDAVWGWQDTVTKQVDLRAKAKRVNFFICDEHVDEPLLVYGLALVYKPRGVKGDKKGISRTAVSYD